MSVNVNVNPGIHMKHSERWKNTYNIKCDFQIN